MIYENINSIRTGDLTEPSGTETSTWFTGEISSNWEPTQSGRTAIGRLTCETSNPGEGQPNLIHIDSFNRYPMCFSNRPFQDGFRPIRS